MSPVVHFAEPSPKETFGLGIGLVTEERRPKAAPRYHGPKRDPIIVISKERSPRSSLSPRLPSLSPRLEGVRITERRESSLGVVAVERRSPAPAGRRASITLTQSPRLLSPRQEVRHYHGATLLVEERSLGRRAENRRSLPPPDTYRTLPHAQPDRILPAPQPYPVFIERERPIIVEPPRTQVIPPEAPEAPVSTVEPRYEIRSPVASPRSPSIRLSPPDSDVRSTRSEATSYRSQESPRDTTTTHRKTTITRTTYFDDDKKDTKRSREGRRSKERSEEVIEEEVEDSREQRRSHRDRREERRERVDREAGQGRSRSPLIEQDRMLPAPRNRGYDDEIDRIVYDRDRARKSKVQYLYP